jgi:hypothetical protein
MEWFIGRYAFIHLNLLVLHIGKKQSTVYTPTSNCALWTRQIYMHNQVVYHALSFLLLQGSCMYLMFRCNLRVYVWTLWIANLQIYLE